MQFANMHRPRFGQSLCLGLMVVIGVLAAPARALTDQDVEKKINELKESLYAKQNKDVGGWFDKYHKGPKQKVDPKDLMKTLGGENSKNVGGPSAIAADALLLSGESFQDPRLAKALDYLRKIRIVGTYALSFRTHVWSYLPDKYHEQLQKDGQQFLKAYHPKRSTFQYHALYKVRDHKRIDHSVSQYGTLALWQYAKRGGGIPRSFWEHLLKHWVKAQLPDGGWSYDMGQDNERQTMTCAGLTVLAIAQEQILRDQRTAEPKLQKAIRDGLAYMDKHFNPGQHSQAGGGYFRYGIERVMQATGVKYFRGKDIFKSIAKKIVDSNGRGIERNAYDLMFLSRGRVPIWANKIKLSDAAWNNRPNDLYFTSRYLSEVRENEVNWQVIPLEKPVRDYLNAPVSWLSTNEKFQLGDKEQAHLKKYLDLGGMLVANSESSSIARESFEKLAKKMYPGLEWKQLSSDSPIAHMVYETGRGGGVLPIRVLSNGVRPLILMPRADWGFDLQSKEDLSKVDAGKYMTNIYAFASGRGVLPNRLEEPYPEKKNEGANKVWISQARFGDDDKRGDVEPQAFEPLSNILANKSNIDLNWAAQPLDEIAGGVVDDHKTKLVHLSGVKAYELSDSEKKAMKSFVDGGGTILIETVGGRGEFAPSLERQLRKVFETAPRRLSRAGASDPIMTGKGLNGGNDLASVYYRMYSLINMDAGSKPRLAAFMVDGRPAVIISAEDLSLGALGVRHWGINGYTTDASRDILANIILAANQGP